MPCETHEDRAVRAVVVVGVCLELLGDGVVDSLVVGLGVSAGGGRAYRALRALELIGAICADAQDRHFVVAAKCEESTTGGSSNGDRGKQHLAGRRAARWLRRRWRTRSRRAVVTNARTNRGTSSEVTSRCSQRLRNTETSAERSHLDGWIETMEDDVVGGKAGTRCRFELSLTKKKRKSGRSSVPQNTHRAEASFDSPTSHKSTSPIDLVL